MPRKIKMTEARRRERLACRRNVPLSKIVYSKKIVHPRTGKTMLVMFGTMAEETKRC